METHADRLRSKYMAWVHELGESRIGGKRLIDRLALGDGSSYWWMTLLVEQNPWKSPSIGDAIRLLALEEVVAQHGSTRLTFVSADRRLHKVLERFSLDLGLAYEWDRIPGQAQAAKGVKGIYRALPQAVQAVLSIARQLRGRWPLGRADKSGWFGGDAAVFFCSYFLHLDREAFAAGRFHSHQWENLPTLLHNRGYRANWLQHYLESSAVPGVDAAKELVRRFNLRRDEQGFHSFVDAYLSWRVVLRASARWFRLVALSSRLGAIRHAFRPAGSRFSMWPLLRGDWFASMRGPVAISNLLWIELFDEALRDLPHQPQGLFLCENHEWERAMILAWRKHGHGRLIGVVHSTVRFWDLRYFTDPRTVRASDRHALPQADFIALNGKAAVDAYLGVDFPQEAIVECEALRYLHLNELPAGRAIGSDRKNATRVLVLGDSEPRSTRSMLRLLEAAAPGIPAPVSYTVKPHPAVAVDATDYPSLNLEVVTAHLREIMQDFDIAYSANTTSAAVDAYFAGLPVVVMLDATELNYSPLRGRSGVQFVSTPAELAAALRPAPAAAQASPDRRDFFFLDPELPRWKSLFAHAGVPG